MTMVTLRERVTVGRVGTDWEVTLRRFDDTLRRVGLDTNREGAEVAAEELREAILDGDPWAMRLLDVSAGELRSA